MKIGFDFDGTLTEANYIEGVINRVYGVQGTPNTYDLNGYYKEHFDIDIDWGREVENGLTIDDFFTFTPFRNDAKEVIDTLEDMGHEIVIVTARNFYKEEVTKEYAKVYFGREIPMIFTGGNPNKKDILKDLGVDVYVDDHPRAAEMLSGSLITPIIMSTNYNKHNTFNYRINSLKEIFFILSVLESFKTMWFD